MGFFNMTSEDALKQTESSALGLSTAQAEERRAKHGDNSLQKPKKVSIPVMFLLQLKNTMTIILLVAAIISGIFGELVDMAIILAVVILNAVLGVAQEAKAEKSIESLQKLSAQKSKVKRDGKIVQIDSSQITIGDIVVLEAGDSVPCDVRIIECHSLSIEESALTGESVPSNKHSDALADKEMPLGDRKNMAFMGTNVTYGRCEAVAVAIGMDTQMGKIAHMLNQTDNDVTPLQKQMNGIGKMLSIAVLIICAIIFGVRMLWHIGQSFGKDFLMDSFLTAVSLAVAAIPEGLTAVITLVMTLGVTRMSKNNAIIRKLPSIETLGCAEIICSDKTGTLTQNKMTVQEIFTFSDDKSDVNRLVTTAVLCNDSTVDGKKILGDPTETALVSYAMANEYDYFKIMTDNVRVGEVPFDSQRKLMSTVNRAPDGTKTLNVKGAADELLAKCAYVQIGGKVVPIDDKIKKQVADKVQNMAQRALRVLGFAYRPKKHDEAVFSDENYLVFVGLMGMIDPVRPEVAAAIKKCFSAGITPIMITGDHLITAVAIGKELGLINYESQAITGKELDRLSDEEFEKVLSKYRVYARVSPENKVRIVKFWKARGKICAMTGDGVNDAPALKTANIGIGMGITGTDVTKNVADMVLADDNFATIVLAVEEGRKIYNNIKKTIQFLLSSNLCEVLTLFVATIFNFTLLRPVQILWVNLVTDTAPALGLGLETSEKDVMARMPRKTGESAFAHGMGARIIYQSLIMSALVLGAYFIGRATSGDVGMTMAFAVLSLVQTAHSFNLKSAENTLFSKKIFNNKVLSLSAIATTALTVALIYVPVVNGAFGLTALSAINLMWCFVLALSIIPIVEVTKIFIRKYKKY